MNMKASTHSEGGLLMKRIYKPLVCEIDGGEHAGAQLRVVQSNGTFKVIVNGREYTANFETGELTETIG